jgi:hypothetical protein
MTTPDFVAPVDASEKRLARKADYEAGITRGTTCASPPDACDLCGRGFARRAFFVDGQLRGELMWGNLCGECFFERGEGIGWGDGQLYAHRTDGSWLLVAGFPPDD